MVPFERESAQDLSSGTLLEWRIAPNIHVLITLFFSFGTILVGKLYYYNWHFTLRGALIRVDTVYIFWSSDTTYLVMQTQLHL